MEEVNIELKCPHCTHENKIVFSKEIKCKKCEKSLIGGKFRQPILSGFTTFILCAGIGMTADSYININRPSVKTEYKMMKQCISKYGHTATVRNTCACAVESMAGIVDAQKAKFYGASWLEDVLDEKYNSCRN